MPTDRAGASPDGLAQTPQKNRGGAPKANANRLVHGRYSKRLRSRAQLAELLPHHPLTPEQLRALLAVVRATADQVAAAIADQRDELDEAARARVAGALQAARILVATILRPPT